MDLGQYKHSKIEERKAFIDSVLPSIPGKFRLKEDVSDRHLFPLFELEKTGLEFVWMVGGHFNFGLSDTELSRIKAMQANPNITVSEMKPETKVSIPHLMVMNRPFLESDLEGSAGNQPLFCDFSQAEAICRKYGCRLPEEVEWEYCCRAGKSDLFAFGNEVPEYEVLEKWLSWDFGDKDNVVYNDFGISGLFFGEWCQDFYKPNHAENSPASTDSRVIKGGGAYFWPWQDEEWVWCLSAMRMPSSDLVDNKAAFRMVF